MSFNDSNSTTIALNNQTLSLTSLKLSNLIFGSTATVGIGVTALGVNAPSGLLSLGIGGWAKITLSNGSTGYLPVWV